MRVGLVDCNNFYVSCERVFQPNLNGKPVIVLSNNDGCAVARSAEAKALGVKMGQPMFEIRHLVNKAGLVALSSNYALYGDLSNRVSTVLSDNVPEIEVYSVDESFVDLDNLDVPDLTEWCRGLRKRVHQWTGIPVSVGIGPTKTLAKLANRLAKKSPRANGVLDLTDRPDWIRAALAKTEVGDVWGIGHQFAKKCAAVGIVTALDLTGADNDWVRRTLGNIGLRTVMELRGTAVHSLETEPEDRKTCCVSRSFGEAVADLEQVRSALIDYASRAAEKLRKDGLVAGGCQVFISTDRFREEDPQRAVSGSAALEPPTADSTRIVRQAVRLLEALWKDGYRYRKTGILLVDLIRPENIPKDLFSPVAINPKTERLMMALDAANGRFGRGALHLGLSSPTADWRMRRDNKTPSFTTSWAEIPTVTI